MILFNFSAHPFLFKYRAPMLSALSYVNISVYIKREIMNAGQFSAGSI